MTQAPPVGCPGQQLHGEPMTLSARIVDFGDGRVGSEVHLCPRLNLSTPAAGLTPFWDHRIAYTVNWSNDTEGTI